MFSLLKKQAGIIFVVWSPFKKLSLVLRPIPELAMNKMLHMRQQHAKIKLLAIHC